jgi:hypothetical protein
MENASYQLFGLESVSEEFVSFKLSGKDELHHLVQDALHIDPAFVTPDPERHNSYLVTYYLDPAAANYIYKYVELIAEDYASGINLSGTWWDFIERGY